MQKKKLFLTLGIASLISLAGCNETIITSSEDKNVESSETSVLSESSESSELTDTSLTSSESKVKLDTNCSPTIYLAGDSTVKTYEANQFIGGWGQFLDLFLEDDIKVVNAAQGGRSSRSFINEGRLYNIENNNYSFKENGGKSIEDVIKKGDYLLIQFGHNDDSTKFKYNPESNYQTVYDRMVDLGTPDENGIYPTIAATKTSTSSLPDEYTKYAKDSEKTSALTEIKKYGDTYYEYGSGTYKWYLKEYIDFARSKGATPILVTPVARVAFNSDGTLKSGPGLHGEDFAYVKAMKQLASETDTMIIDLFSRTKEMLEKATSTYANYLMALKPNSLIGTWPTDYDLTYGKTDLGYTGIEATHYNKYGAFLEAGFVASELKNLKCELNSHNEYVNFSSKININPETYIDPSNLLSKSIAIELENLNKDIHLTNPNRTYLSPDNCISLIDNLLDISKIDETNYEEVLEKANEAKDEYNRLNIDDRSSVSNYQKLVDVLDKINQIIDSLRPKASKTILIEFSSLESNETYTSNVLFNEYLTIFASTSKSVLTKNLDGSFNYQGTTYQITKAISLGGSANYQSGRFIGINVDKNATVTIVAKSTGTTDRSLALYNSNDLSTSLATISANTTISTTTVSLTDAGTYYAGSTGSGVYICYIIIEYFN